MQLKGQQQDLWPFIASIIYTVVWSVSFYPQIYLNYKLKSVQGFPLDYLIINITGYSFYTTYTTIGYFTDIKGAGTVVIADLIFVYHAVFFVIVQAIQCYIYEKGKNRISGTVIIIVITLWVFQIVQAILYMTGIVQYYQYWNPLTALGYGKLYTPPVYWNYKRKSTKGWSILKVLLDMVGGICSLASGGFSVQNGLNIIKVILAFISLLYDLIFCFQHYVLYRKKSNTQAVPKEEERSLINSEKLSDQEQK